MIKYNILSYYSMSAPNNSIGLEYETTTTGIDKYKKERKAKEEEPDAIASID